MSIEIKNSPLPFVLVGPGGRFRQLFARSEEYDISLIGACDLALTVAGGEAQEQLSEGKKVNIVTAWISHVAQSTDDRSRLLSFAWFGDCDHGGRRTVLLEFMKRSSDIAEATQSEDIASLEWHLGAILYLCLRENRDPPKRVLAEEIARITNRWIMFLVASIVPVAAAISAAVTKLFLMR